MNRFMYGWGLGWVLPIMIVGCQSLEDKDAAYYLIPQGARLVLKQELQIPGGTARIALQDGRPRPYGLVNEFYPYCEFEVREVRPTAQSVRPDEFLIAKVARRVYSVGRSSRMRMTAGLGFSIGLGAADGPRQTFYATVLYLRSAQQPNVLKLTCESDQRGFPGITYARHLTVEEIQQALGQVMTLRMDHQ